MGGPPLDDSRRMRDANAGVAASTSDPRPDARLPGGLSRSGSHRGTIGLRPTLSEPSDGVADELSHEAGGEGICSQRIGDLAAQCLDAEPDDGAHPFLCTTGLVSAMAED